MDDSCECKGSWEAKRSRDVCCAVCRPGGAEFTFHPRKQQGPCGTLGGKDFIFICWDGKVTHLRMCKVNCRHIWLCQLQRHEGSSAQPGLFRYCPGIPSDYSVPVQIGASSVLICSEETAVQKTALVFRVRRCRAQKYVWWITVMPVVLSESEELGTPCLTWRWKDRV